MSAATLPAREAPFPDRMTTADIPAVSRGRLEITERVVQKVAAQAASEVGAAGGRSGGLFGLGAHTDLAARPRVEAVLSRDAVDLSLAVAVAYPTSIRTAAQQIREHVADRVHQLTGIPVHRIDIDIIAAGAADRAHRESSRRSLR